MTDNHDNSVAFNLEEWEVGVAGRHRAGLSLGLWCLPRLGKEGELDIVVVEHGCACARSLGGLAGKSDYEVWATAVHVYLVE